MNNDFSSLKYHGFQGETDYSIIQSILEASDRVDHVTDTISLEAIRNWLAPSNRFDPYKDLIFSTIQLPGEEPVTIGFSRIGWYTGLGSARLYNQSSYLHPDWRELGFWPEMVRKNELRLREIAATHPTNPLRFYQAWATESQAQWISVLESEGFRAVRHFKNMLHPLVDIPTWPLETGLEIRQVRPEHLRKIWEARREMEQGLFEIVVERWLEDRYEAWLEDPSNTPQLWQVAWAGDQLAGMVLNRISPSENEELGRKRGHTEHVYVRPAWQKRGLAVTLLSKSLQALKDQGMDEAEIGVDTENESGAYAFYQKMGYREMSTDIWFRKSMD